MVNLSTLYRGTNSNGQKVFTWVTNQTLTSFDSDFASLLGSLVAKKMVPPETYIGEIQFGTETFFANEQMSELHHQNPFRDNQADFMFDKDFSVGAFEAEVRNVSGGATSTASMPTATLIAQPTQSSAADLGCTSNLLFVLAGLGVHVALV